jgi:5'(3')-deoxyribonucleotidase
MIIMCDIDGVLNNLTQAAIDICNEHMGTILKMDDITSYNFDECLPTDIADTIIALFKLKEFWNDLRPIEGSQKYLRQLIKNGHQVYLATATDPINFEWKCQWIKQYFNFIPTENIIRIMDKSLLKCDVMIDDCLDNLTSNICERVCLDYPYNRDTSKDYSYDIYRANNWRDIIYIINEIERKNKEWEK